VITDAASTPFAILPAIDLRRGSVVRLEQGRFDRERVYATDPPAVVAAFRDAGAKWIHVVDLDAARTGARREEETVAAIVRACGDEMRVELAGGLRDEAAVQAALHAGASRVVIGTSALRAGGFVAGLVTRHGAARIAVALDIRDGSAVGDGWVPGAQATPWPEVVRRAEDAGVATFVVTAIDRDGLLGGPDLALLERVVGATRADVIASGGIRSLADLEATRSLGCAGAIVGRALYDGSIDLAAAIRALSSTAAPTGPASDR
jgi:phosphoribosylformimino-5-aminoimidazole carboxamide ribotide isomerase